MQYTYLCVCVCVLLIHLPYQASSLRILHEAPAYWSYLLSPGPGPNQVIHKLIQCMGKALVVDADYGQGECIEAENTDSFPSIQN